MLTCSSGPLSAQPEAGPRGDPLDLLEPATARCLHACYAYPAGRGLPQFSLHQFPDTALASQRAGGMEEAGPGGDPLDLLEPATARRLAAGPSAPQQAQQRPGFASQGGRLVVREDEPLERAADPAGERASVACSSKHGSGIRQGPSAPQQAQQRPGFASQGGRLVVREDEPLERAADPAGERTIVACSSSVIQASASPPASAAETCFARVVRGDEPLECAADPAGASWQQDGTPGVRLLLQPQLRPFMSESSSSLLGHVSQALTLPLTGPGRWPATLRRSKR